MIFKFSVTGMTCAACSSRVENVTRKLSGVNKVEVNLLAGSMIVDAESDAIIDTILEAVSKAGYSAEVCGAKKQTSRKHNNSVTDMKVRIIWSAVFLVALMYFTMGHMIGLPLPSWYHGEQNAMTAALLQFLLTLPIVVLNRSYYTRGLKALFNRAPNMDSLVAIGSGASLLYGIIALFVISNATGHGNWEAVSHYSKNLYFESAGMILTLVTLGKYLESRAKAKTGDALQKLMDISPKTAVVRRDDNLVELPIDAVVKGDVVCVKAGGTIPVDGTVVSGRAAIDQSALTGESVPVERTVGDVVSAATINTDGYLEIRAEKVGSDTTLAQVIRLVEEAGGSKAPIARLADKIAGIFVPVVMCIALVALIVWLLIGQTFEFALTTAIAVLVISCPCALGLATPVAIMVGTGRGASMGILFKNAEALENLHRVDTVVFDKTGTLTLGKPVVTDIIPNDVSQDKLLMIAASLEATSEHPFAKAIMEKAEQYRLETVEDFTTLPGYGVCGEIDGIKHYGGNKALMEKLNISVPTYAEYAAKGKTPLYFADESGRYLGTILAADVLKEDSPEIVEHLKKIGLKVIMLTGDNHLTADSVAKAAQVDEVIAQVLPTEKAAQIKRLQSQGRNVLMVGDGINDAPALATANVGMAIGAGTDIAIESADIVLMHSSLAGICNAIALSRATMRNIRQNLFWAFFYNCLGIPVAAGVLYPLLQLQLSPMIGAAAMSFSSVFVVTNALRLRLFKPAVSVNAESLNTVQMEDKEMDVVIKVEGMMCTHCQARVENVCKGIAGVTNAVVDLQKKQVTVSGSADINQVKQAITDAGYEVIG